MNIRKILLKHNPSDILGKCDCGFYGKFKYIKSEQKKFKKDNLSYAYFQCPKCKGMLTSNKIIQNKYLK